MKLYKDSFLFHHQTRIGKNGRAISITKFRTMPTNSHSDFGKNGRNKLFNEVSIREKKAGRFGKFLRSTKIDEIPQLINLLKDEIGLVGIRVIPRQTYQALPKEIQEIYNTVGPGLLGISYALPENQRTQKNIFEEYKRFFKYWKKNKMKAKIKWIYKILRNWKK